MPATQIDLVNQLLALNSPDQPFKISAAGNEVVATWNLVDAQWLELFSKAGMTKNYKMVLTLDATRSTAKMVEHTADVNWSIGIPITAMSTNWTTGTQLVNMQKGVAYGIRPNMSVGQIYSYDFDVNRVKGPVLQVLQMAGWKTTLGSTSKGAMILVGFVVVCLLLMFGLTKANVLHFQSNVHVTPYQTGKMFASPTPEASQTPIDYQTPIASPAIGSLVFTNIEVGQTMSASHQIINPSTTVTDKYGTVNFKVYLQGAQPGDTVDSQLTYLATGKSIKGKSITITDRRTVDVIAMFEPVTSWKAGEYLAEFTASNGQTKSITFTVLDSSLNTTNTGSTNSTMATTNANLTITDVSLSQSKLDNDQLVSPGTYFKDTFAPLYARANIQDGQLGDVVQVQLTNFTTGQAGQLKSFTLDSSATSYLLMAYSAPTNGWALGSYKVDFITPNGHKSTMYFSFGQ